MATTIKTKIVIRNDIKNNWETANPTLSKGEIGLETDTLRMKVGNGTTDWSSLPYYNENKVGATKEYSPKHPGDIAIVDGITYIWDGNDWKQIGVDAYTKSEIDQWASYDKDNSKLKIGAADELILETQHQDITLNADGVMVTSNVTISGGLQVYGDELSNLLRYDGIEQNVISTTYAKISYVDAEISNVMAVAEGKTKTYIMSGHMNNNVFNTQDDIVNLIPTDIPTISDYYGNTINLLSLKTGDILLFTDVDIPDRWVGSVYESVVVFYKLETRKIDLNPIINEIWGSSTSTTASSRIDNLEVADAGIITRLELVEDSLGLGGGGVDGGIAEQIASIKTEIWGSAEMSASSRIDDIVNSNPICTLSESQERGHLVFDYMDESEGDVNLIDAIFGVSSIASNAMYLVSSETKVSVLNELADNLTVSATEINTAANFVRNLVNDGVSEGVIRQAVSYVSTLNNAHSVAEVVLAISYVTTLKDTYYANEIISAVAWVDANQTKAITSVTTDTLVVSHVGNNLAINLPSVIWLDGGNAAGAYEAEEAVYNELLNNEYGN